MPYLQTTYKYADLHPQNTMVLGQIETNGIC